MNNRKMANNKRDSNDEVDNGKGPFVNETKPLESVQALHVHQAFVSKSIFIEQFKVVFQFLERLVVELLDGWCERF